MKEKEIDKLVDECMWALKALEQYDARYIGNLPEKKAKKLFPELFDKKPKKGVFYDSPKFWGEPVTGDDWDYKIGAGPE